MPNWTLSDFNSHLARHSAQVNAQAGEGVPIEGQLHDDIMDECRKRGWLVLHGRMDRKTGRTSGEPDFIIFAHGGQVFLVECKTKTGKLSPAQQALHAHARHLGHVVHTVRSMADFLSLI